MCYYNENYGWNQIMFTKKHTYQLIPEFYFFFIKGNAQFAQKVTFEPLMDFKQNHY